MSESLPPEARARLLRDAGDAGTETGGTALLYGRYRVVRELGRGGMGVVYEAEDVALRRRVALKLLKLPARAGPGLAEQVLREARAAARLDHPNIAAVYDAYTGPEGDAIALQFVDGKPLSEIERPEPRALVAWLRDAALAVHHAHEQGIVHRDLKPHNLMIDGARVVVTDFGLAKELALDTSLSLSGSVLGTPSYMPPEQAGGRAREVDARSDVYALGATLYDRLAGRPPFVAGDVVTLLRAVIEDEPPPLARVAPAVPRDLARVVHKCLAKEKERRYASARALADDLGRWLAGEPVRAEAPSLAYRCEKFVRRHRGAVAAALVLALGALGAAAVVWSERAARRANEDAVELVDRVDHALDDARRLRTSDPALADAKLDAAIERCRAALARYETHQVRTKLGTLLLERGRPDEARAEFERALALSPEFAPARLERGILTARAALEDGGGPLREGALRDLAVLDDAAGELGVLEAVRGRAERARLLGRADEARREYAELARLDPGAIEVPLALAPLALAEDDPAAALEQAFGAMDLFRGFATPAGARAADDGAATSAGGAAATLEIPGIEGRFTDHAAALAARPSTAAAYANRAQGALRACARAAAERHFDDALAACDQARADLESALTIVPELAGARGDRGLVALERARLLARLGRGEEGRTVLAGALADLAAELAASPTSAAAENRALGARRAAEDAFARGALGEARAAIAAALPVLETALTAVPTDAGLWLARARLLVLSTRSMLEMVLVDHTPAEEAFEHAIALAPLDARPRAARGLARLGWGDTERGKADVEAALFLGPEPELRAELVAALDAED